MLKKVEIQLNTTSDFAGIVSFVGPERDPLRAVGMRFDQRQCRQALGMARSAGCHGANDWTVAVLHQRVAHETQPRFFAWPLTVEAGIGIGGRDMRVVGTPLTVEILLTIAPRAGRFARPVLRPKALGA